MYINLQAVTLQVKNVIVPEIKLKIVLSSNPKTLIFNTPRTFNPISTKQHCPNIKYHKGRSDVFIYLHTFVHCAKQVWDKSRDASIVPRWVAWRSRAAGVHLALNRISC